MRKRPWVIGLIGGIGSGKSTVAGCFERLGAEVVDADRVAHGLLDRPALRRNLVEEWGRGILSDGRVDRAALAARAFRSAASVRKLNAIVHPRVHREIAGRIAACRRPVLVLDAPLLLEAEADALCDLVIFVDAPRGVRARRIRARGWGPEELRRRERLQWSDSRKRARADYVIDNRGSRATAARQVRALIRGLVNPSHPEGGTE
ncbi:MAG: dephospho-CoA kinase [Planctomycetes bacterium]|nr:dephospho-CoA kinase [Planctomycetota bacterium]